MGLWILNDNHLEHVPGTAPLADTNEGNRKQYISELRHSSGKDKDIILVPQPSESPRDPLNWPLWRKDTVFLILCCSSAITNAWSFMLTPGFGVLAEEFDIVESY